MVQTLQDIARMRARELTGGTVDQTELQIAQATLKNMGVVAGLVVRKTVLDVLNDSLKMAGSIITGILKT